MNGKQLLLLVITRQFRMSYTIYFPCRLRLFWSFLSRQKAHLNIFTLFCVFFTSLQAARQLLDLTHVGQWEAVQWLYFSPRHHFQADLFNNKVSVRKNESRIQFSNQIKPFLKHVSNDACPHFNPLPSSDAYMVRKIVYI